MACEAVATAQATASAVGPRAPASDEPTAIPGCPPDVSASVITDSLGAAIKTYLSTTTEVHSRQGNGDVDINTAVVHVDRSAAVLPGMPDTSTGQLDGSGLSSGSMWTSVKRQAAREH